MLKRSIKSVLKQKYENIEIIVVDDNVSNSKSRKETNKVIEKFKENNNNINYIKHEKNMGGSKARNTGIEAAQGDYIAFLDDDDEWDSEKLNKQIERLSTSKIKNIKVIYTGSKTYNNNKLVKKRLPKHNGNVYDNIIDDNIVPGGGSSILIKKECFDEVGGFNENLPAAQDYDMWIRLAKVYNFDYVAEPLTINYIHGKHRITDNISSKKKAYDFLYNEYYKKEFNIFKANKKYALKLERIGHWLCLSDNMFEGRSIYIQAIKKWPLSPKLWFKYIISLTNKNLYKKIWGAKRKLFNQNTEVRKF
mgnify:CR=1 FL=1